MEIICEVCRQSVSDKRRVEVGFFPYSATCSVNCEEYLKNQIANSSNEQLLIIYQNEGNRFGVETFFKTLGELQKRGIIEKPNINISNAPNLKSCFECGEQTDSLKNYRVMNVFVFLIIFMVARGIDYQACPSCMRKKITMCAGIQILTAHVVFPIILIFHVVQFCRTFVRGHSN